MSVVIRGGAFKSILFRVPVRNAGSAPPLHIQSLLTMSQVIHTFTH